MPAKSKSQQRLMAAAEHAADFGKAREVRESMSLAEMRAYASGPMKGEPERVKKKHNPIGNLGHHAHPPKRRK